MAVSLPPFAALHGGYRKLRSFQVAEAARSGRQNIAEGSMASATSKKSELKLTNVAKASLEKFLLDYEDFSAEGASALVKGFAARTQGAGMAG